MGGVKKEKKNAGRKRSQENYIPGGRFIYPEREITKRVKDSP